MKNKNIIIAVVSLFIVALGVVFFIKNKQSKNPEVVVEEKPSLPVNVIPVSERPFITLSPDTSGRNLTLLIDNIETEDKLEYELVYNATDKQEGAFGRIDFSSEKLPVEKDLLLGSKSAGGSVTYHEGVTGGSLTVTYDETKLKESFNFLRFDTLDPFFSSQDSRFEVELGAKALASNTVVVVMKTFGLPESLEGELIAGPYAFLPASAPKGDVTVSVKLPAGEHENPVLMEYYKGAWVEVESTLTEDTLSGISSGGSVFVVTK